MAPVQTKAVAWSATMGLIPGYGHDNDPATVAARKAMLIELWDAAMERTYADTGFTVSAVMTDALVVYPQANGCPVGGEQAVTLTGSSNPTKVDPGRFDDFIAAVEDMVLRVQAGMEQTSVRIEFSLLERSVYSRVEKPATV